MLRKLAKVQIKGSMVTMVYRERVPHKQDRNESEMHATKFEGLKRLIERHWLEGLPLWSCVAGRQGEASDSARHVSDEEDEFHTLHGPASLDNLTN